MFIPDPNFTSGSSTKGQKGTGSRIRDEELGIFNPKNLYQALGNMIRHIYSGSEHLCRRIRNDFIKKTKIQKDALHVQVLPCKRTFYLRLFASSYFFTITL
jgi:hypothetical protein